MLTVDDYAKIRLARRDNMSIREIARTFGHSRRKVRQVLANAEPTPYTRAKPAPAPVLGALHGVIDGILAADEQAPPKQRHTAMQVFRRLCDEYTYAGGYDPGPPLHQQAPPRPPRDLHPAGARPRPAPGSRLRPHLRRFS